ncbi:uncharacterized protein LOC105703662 [Orussus abietinus]|uniref:uncharacterized protein LOC105703662 n=1 Tax=Orussus abietinus TaxID=222816 RepID=UPI00062571AE|nr:uncharacterized protein LOC105703662 [Orussus abietinus]
MDMEQEHTGRETNKVCGVCGDKALGYNFNAVSCESCKAFFRRNALKNKDFRCPFTENCEITVITRRFCQKCRLDKCFNIGMRKEYIMSEEEKVLKRQKIELNRAKKRPPSEDTKANKMKRESLEDGIIDNDTRLSITSGTSVTSTTSEIYVWDSDKKYTILDANRQFVTEPVSPLLVASVPSPSCPPEGTDIVGTRTLEMSRELERSSVLTFGKYTRRSSGLEEIDSDLDSSLPSPSKSDDDLSTIGNFDIVSQTSTKIGSTSLNAVKYDRNTNTFCANFDSVENAPRYTFRFNGTPLNCERSELNSDQAQTTVNTGCSPMDTCLSPTSNVQMSMEEMSMGTKPKQDSSKGSALVEKFKQDPGLITKLLGNPSLVAKIVLDESVLAKIVTDPETMNRLACDPQIEQFLGEHGSSVEVCTPPMECTNQEKTDCEMSNTLNHNGTSNNLIRHILDTEQNEIENPILTNLITGNHPNECTNKIKIPTTLKDKNDSDNDVTKDVLQDVQRIPIAANSIESILCEAIKLEFSAYSAFGGNQTSRELNDAERAKLNELIVANKALLAPLDDDLTNLVGDQCKFKGNSEYSDPMLLDVINLTAVAIRRLIKMSKKINAFKSMCQDDQLALLKGGCTEMLILRSASNYDSDRDMWKIPHSQERMSKIKVDVLKEAKGNLYAEHAKFVRTFDPKWRDENVILILTAIALFTPDRPKVVHSDVIKLEQNSYYYLLRRYLESVHPGCEAKSTFLKLIRKISELHRLNDEVVGVYLNVNPSSVEPLLIEIFDLKH